MQKGVKDIIIEIAKEEGLSIKDVESIVRSPWEYMKDVISKFDIKDKSTDPMFYHIHLGYFSLSKRKINKKKSKNDLHQ